MTVIAHSLKADGFDASEDGTGRGTPLIARCVHTNEGTKLDFETSTILAFSSKDHGADAGKLSPTIRACPHDKSHANSGAPPAIQTGFAVRRLTPVECERLQGFPDGYTAIEYRGKPACDGPRYKALGNSMAVPVLRWLGKRIEQVNRI
jgi:DNA (cytosine-5)-methyltransferase 1